MKQLYLLSFSFMLPLYSIQEKPAPLAVPGHAHETAVEDLASEHGIVERILLIYAEMAQRLKNNRTFAAQDLFAAADIIHRFVENYHEKIEEEYIFSQFEKRKVSPKLIAELHKQHDAGREITEKLLEFAKYKHWTPRQRFHIRKLLEQFTKMYYTHLSREDSELFPEFRKMVTQEEYQRFSELFDDLEDKMFGKHAYHNFLAQIEGIEKRLGIYDISLVTPK